MFKDHGLDFGLGPLFIAELVARVVHASGKTSEVKTMFLPSGDQMASSASVEILVIFFGAPLGVPVAASNPLTHTWELPSTMLM